MNFLPGAGIFAVAGLIAAAGPILIHLLNRRRYRVVNWAAMDFLLEALQRNRRMMHLRDLLLLALRTACVLLFGLALARPYFSRNSASQGSGEPVHAVLVVDNSLSMGYERNDGTLLDEAKAKAKEFLDELPAGSRMSVLPLCGSASGFSLDAYRTKDDARSALDKIEVVDRQGSAAQAADRALEACEQVKDLPPESRRIVFLGDQQAINWPQNSLPPQFKELPEMQIVAVAPRDVENTWIDSFTLQDGIADVESPAVFSVVIRHQGASSRAGVQVTLSVAGAEVATRTVDLEPDQAREVTFEYRFDAPIDAGKAMFVPAKVSIPPSEQDHLALDDARYLAVPVVAALPVVFVDQYGADEEPKKNRYGETRHLRRLLAPITARGEANRQLALIRHVRIEQVDRDLLADARLVVIAGVPSPESAVPLLRDFVKQGGQLLICAGADFDPAAWSQSGWLDGRGILPTPLKPAAIGKLPEEAGELRPFFLSYPSMSHAYFHLADTSDEDLRDLYSEALFFKAVQADAGEQVTTDLLAAEAKRIAEDRQFLEELSQKTKQWAELEAKGALTDGERHARKMAEDKRTAIEPKWLIWAAERQEAEAGRREEESAESTRPRVLASFDNDAPFLIERSIGRGQVLFASSGVFSSWNTLPKTNAILLFDRILRSMLERTLPERNLATLETLPLPVVDQNAVYELKRPDETRERLTVDALGPQSYGVSVQHLTQRGIYTVTALRPDASADQRQSEGKLWELSLAVNGPSTESEPATLDEAGLKQRLGDVSYRWVAPGEAIHLEGAQIRGQNLWKWLIFAVLVLMLVELLVLAWPRLVRERAA